MQHHLPDLRIVFPNSGHPEFTDFILSQHTDPLLLRGQGSLTGLWGYQAPLWADKRPDRGDWWRLQCCPFSHRLAAAQSPPRCSSRFLLLSLPPHSADTIAAADSYWGLAGSQRLCHVFLNWNIVVLQCCVSFSCLAKWISCVHIYSSPFFGFLSYLGHHRALSPFP